jgi:hypothetical protein
VFNGLSLLGSVRCNNAIFQKPKILQRCFQKSNVANDGTNEVGDYKTHRLIGSGLK